MREPRRTVALVAAIASLLLVGACGSSGTTSSLHVTQLANAHEGQLSVTSAWVLEPEAGQGAGDMANMPGMDHNSTPMVAAYGTINNSGTKADAVTEVVAPSGAHADLHVTTNGATSGTMKKVASLGVPAGGETVLKPGGAHVMITGLKPSPKAGGFVTLTFVFGSGARITVKMPVISSADRPTS